MSDILLTNLAIIVNHGDNLTRGQRNVVQQAYAEIERLRAENEKLDAIVTEQRDKIEDARAEIKAKDRGFYPIVNRSGYSDNEFSGGQGQ